jgi:hypothetical protein
MSDLIAGLKPFEAHLLELLSDCFALPDSDAAYELPNLTPVGPAPHPN